MTVFGRTSSPGRAGALWIRRGAVSLGVGLLAAALGTGSAGAFESPAAGTEPAQAQELCPATDPLVGSVEGADQQVSLLRSFLGCNVSEDPGPADPGGG